MSRACREMQVAQMLLCIEEEMMQDQRVFRFQFSGFRTIGTDCPKQASVGRILKT